MSDPTIRVGGEIKEEHLGDLKTAADSLIARFGRSGPGRASALRLLGAYVVYRQEGIIGLRRLGFSRDSVLLYLDKMREAGLLQSKP